MSLLDRLRVVAPADLSRHLRFRVGAVDVGWVAPDLAALLRRFPTTFLVDSRHVALAPRLQDPAARTAAVDAVLRQLRDEGLVPGWRDEPYPVGIAFHAPPLFRMERAAVPLFGVRAYGVHLNGHVGCGAGLGLWVGRRSLTKPTFPGKLDHLVAGGQPAGLTIADNLLKESKEEASLPAALVRRARPVGIVSYLTATEDGVRNDVLFNFDLELPAGFLPVNADGEIAAFELWPIDRVRRVLAQTDDFKFNVALVIIDFLIRHGLVGPDEPDYLALVDGLRNRPGD